MIGNQKDYNLANSSSVQDMVGKTLNDQYGAVNQRIEPYIQAGDYKDAFALASQTDPTAMALTNYRNLKNNLFNGQSLTPDQMSSFYQAFQPYEQRMAGHQSGYYMDDRDTGYQGLPLAWGSNLQNPQDIQTAASLNEQNYGGIPNPAQVLGGHGRNQGTVLDDLKAVGRYVVLPALTMAIGGGFTTYLGQAAAGAAAGAANAEANGGNPWLGAASGAVGSSAPALSEATGISPELASIATHTAAGGINGGATGAESAGLGGALSYGLNDYAGTPSYLGNAAGSALSSYIRSGDPQTAGISGLQRGVTGYLSPGDQKQAARGGSVKSLHDILKGPSFSDLPHFDDGGSVDYVDYFTPDYPSAYDVNLTSPDQPDMSGYILPNDSQSALQQALQSNIPSTGYDINGNQFNVNESGNPLAGYDVTGAPTDQVPNISINAGGLLSGLLGNNNSLGNLWNGLNSGQQLGSAAALASLLSSLTGGNSGGGNMTANYKPTPPPMFQGSGPQATNQYGNFTTTPRQRADASGVDYAHYGQGPAFNFYTPSPAASASPLAASTQANPNIQPVLGVTRAHGGGVTNYSPMVVGHAMGSPYSVPASQGGPRHIMGAGGGREDKIPAVLSDGEWVADAETVSMLGNGSNKEGAKKLDEMRDNLREHKGKVLAQGKFSPNAKKPEQYMKGAE